MLSLTGAEGNVWCPVVIFKRGTVHLNLPPLIMATNQLHHHQHQHHTGGPSIQPLVSFQPIYFDLLKALGHPSRSLAAGTWQRNERQMKGPQNGGPIYSPESDYLSVETHGLSLV